MRGPVATLIIDITFLTCSVACKVPLLHFLPIALASLVVVVVVVEGTGPSPNPNPACSR